MKLSGGRIVQATVKAVETTEGATASVVWQGNAFDLSLAGRPSRLTLHLTNSVEPPLRNGETWWCDFASSRFGSANNSSKNRNKFCGIHPRKRERAGNEEIEHW